MLYRYGLPHVANMAIKSPLCDNSYGRLQPAGLIASGSFYSSDHIHPTPYLGQQIRVRPGVKTLAPEFLSFAA